MPCFRLNPHHFRDSLLCLILRRVTYNIQLIIRHCFCARHHLLLYWLSCKNVRGWSHLSCRFLRLCVLRVPFVLGSSSVVVQPSVAKSSLMVIYNIPLNLLHSLVSWIISENHLTFLTHSPPFLIICAVLVAACPT